MSTRLAEVERSMAAWLPRSHNPRWRIECLGVRRRNGMKGAIVGLLRTLLAFSVLLDHAWNGAREALLGGRLAVQTFYLISGFLISYVLTATDTYRHAQYRFYQNRLLRLYPPYVVVAGLTLVVHVALHTSFLSGLGEMPIDAEAPCCFPTCSFSARTGSFSWGSTKATWH